MGALRRVMVLVAIAAVGLTLGSCTRKITRIEQVVQGPQLCFQCHSDTSTFLVAATEQWEHSKHASGETTNENDGTCKGCHTSEGFVARATGTTAPDVIANPTAIHCFTCHAPHSNGDFRTRWTTVATLANGTTYDLKAGNLCAACHVARRNVGTTVVTRTTMTNRFGPHHSVQADMLIGSNGYEYAGFTYERSNHRSATENGCIDCHKKTTTGIILGGHSFNMAYDPGTGEIQNTAACEECHGAIDDFSDVGTGFSVQDSVDVLMTDLEARLVTAGLWTAGLPKATTTSKDSAGAVWNLLMAKEDRSHGVHNAKYTLGLLNSAIQFIKTGPPPAPLATKTHGSAGLIGSRH